MTLSRLRGITYSSVILLCLASVPLCPQGSSGSAHGVIRGKIAISRPDDVTEEIMRGRMLNRYETSAGLSEKPFQPYSLPEKAVVYIESVSGKYTPPQIHPALDQRDMVFRPLVLPVVVGTTVDFPNSDPLFHNVFSLSAPKEFDLGKYPKGQHRSVTFDKEGVVSVYCEIHSYMFATILVLQNPYFSQPDQGGDFEIADVPRGTYQLSFWYGRKKAETRTVTVTPNQTTTANFQYIG
jgi:plastocyanin